MSKSHDNIREFIGWLRGTGATEIKIADIYVRFAEGPSLVPSNLVDDAVNDFDEEERDAPKYDPMYYMSS